MASNGAGCSSTLQKLQLVTIHLQALTLSRALSLQTNDLRD
jgi:hypothetical protein